MTEPRMILVAILVGTLALFIWGRWRHDMVALAALLSAVFTGIVPASRAFEGLGHPAVITVACVLILSRGLQTSGALDVAVRRFIPGKAGLTPTISMLGGVAATLSAVMNNIGALALLMPLANQIAKRFNIAPGRLLMPLSFASILGGMTTLIGTPPNLIVSGFRAQGAGQGFAMFDFTPVGLTVALAGLSFVALVGWRLVPDRKRFGPETSEISAYLTEARVPEKAKAIGMTLREIENELDAAGAQVVGLIRNEVSITGPGWFRRLQAGDILVIEAEPGALSAALAALGLRLEEERQGSTVIDRDSAIATAPAKPSLIASVPPQAGNTSREEKPAETPKKVERVGQAAEIVLWPSW